MTTEERLRARVAELDRRMTKIQKAVDCSGGRWSEWGIRAEAVADLLDEALDGYVPGSLPDDAPAAEACGDEFDRRCDGCAYWQRGTAGTGGCHHAEGGAAYHPEIDVGARNAHGWCNYFWPRSVPLPRPWESGIVAGKR